LLNGEILNLGIVYRDFNSDMSKAYVPGQFGGNLMRLEAIFHTVNVTDVHLCKRPLREGMANTWGRLYERWIALSAG
jgi:hypothetical protein